MSDKPAAEGFDREEARAIVEHFAKIGTVTNDHLLEFCNLHGYAPVSVDVYADYKFSYEHDTRVTAALPEIMAALSKIQNPPELTSTSERKKIQEANEAIQEEICFLLEKHGILYQEVDLLTTGLGSLLKGTMDGASRRVNNMASLELLKAAEEKFGKPLTIRTLGESQRGGKKGETSVEAKTEEKSERPQVH